MALLEIDRELCIGCEACVEACAFGALSMDDENIAAVNDNNADGPDAVALGSDNSAEGINSSAVGNNNTAIGQSTLLRSVDGSNNTALGW